MLDSSCRLKSIKLKITSGKSFVEACFGITVHHTPQFELFYRAVNDPSEVALFFLFGNHALEWGPPNRFKPNKKKQCLAENTKQLYSNRVEVERMVVN